MLFEYYLAYIAFCLGLRHPPLQHQKIIPEKSAVSTSEKDLNKAIKETTSKHLERNTRSKLRSKLHTTVSSTSKKGQYTVLFSTMYIS